MRKSELKNVALKLFSSKGYEQTSLSAIAKEVGIKTPSIYAFYSSKEELFLTVVHDVFFHHYQFIKNLTDSFGSETCEQKLYKILLGMYEFHMKEEEETNFARRFVMFAPEGLENRLHEEFAKSDVLLSKVLEGIFLDAIEHGEIRELSLESLVASYLCLMDGLFLQLVYYRNDADFLEKRLKNNWEIYWSGIKAENAGITGQFVGGRSNAVFGG